MKEIYISRIKKVRSSSCPMCLRREILAEFGHVDGYVLDVGCGVGDPTKLLERRCKYIVGLDVSNFFNRSKISPIVDFCEGDAFRLPFRDESFDAVVSFDVIEHVPDALGFLREIRRVMKKSAKLLLETPNRERLSIKMKGLVKPVKYPIVIGPCCIHIKEYSKEELEKLLKTAGFKDVRIKGVWLGLRGQFEVGTSKFPSFLEKYSQCWLLKAIRSLKDD